jgi:hypothetical protein
MVGVQPSPASPLSEGEDGDEGHVYDSIFQSDVS